MHIMIKLFEGKIIMYQAKIDLKATQVAIKMVKDFFEKTLAEKLNLLRVSAPLFVDPNTGLNDNLTGVEKAVSFSFRDKQLEIVQSLAKWKRYALAKYNLTLDQGLYTDMNAIRPFETIDNLHSIYVDQWDWEKPIARCNRNLEFLKETVAKIYDALKLTNEEIAKHYPSLKKDLPDELFFITTNDLEKMYPNLSYKERENKICESHKAVFLMQIGWPLKGGEPHDLRAADYDDWHLNGDLLVWFDVLGIALELSSMGIRVDEESLVLQTKAVNEEHKLKMMYHQAILNNELPLSIGGGIGQSRLCMFLLDKAHIGEVQSSYWTEEEIKKALEQNIKLL